MRDGYVLPDVADRLFTELNQGLLAGRCDVEDADALAACLTEDVRRTSGDSHLRVRYSEAPHVSEAEGDVVREQNDRAEHCRRMGYGIEPAQRLDTGIAIVTIKELVEPELSRAAFEVTFASISNAKALVIDLRDCVGGDPQKVAIICSHLFDTRAQISSVAPRFGAIEHFYAEPSAYPNRFGGRKPVFIAVANFTFSGAEMLAYDLQAAKRATMVGAVTGGGANPCAFHWPSAHFSALLPEARSVNPITGSNREGCGVVPDVACNEVEALRIAIERAVS